MISFSNYKVSSKLSKINISLIMKDKNSLNELKSTTKTPILINKNKFNQKSINFKMNTYNDIKLKPILNKRNGFFKSFPYQSDLKSLSKNNTIIPLTQSQIYTSANKSSILYNPFKNQKNL